MLFRSVLVPATPLSTDIVSTTHMRPATQWIRSHSQGEIYDMIEPYVASTSREANVFEITIMKAITDYDGIVDAASFERGSKIWFREMTGIKPLTMPEIVAAGFVEAARKAYPA